MDVLLFRQKKSGNKPSKFDSEIYIDSDELINFGSLIIRTSFVVLIKIL